MSRTRVEKRLALARQALADHFEDRATRPAVSAAATELLSKLVKTLRDESGTIPEHFRNDVLLVARSLKLTEYETNLFISETIRDYLQLDPT